MHSRKEAKANLPGIEIILFENWLEGLHESKNEQGQPKDYRLSKEHLEGSPPDQTDSSGSETFFFELVRTPNVLTILAPFGSLSVDEYCCPSLGNKKEMYDLDDASHDQDSPEYPSWILMIGRNEATNHCANRGTT